MKPIGRARARGAVGANLGKHAWLAPRLALGGVLAWFGGVELWSPANWSVYVPHALAFLDPGLLWVHATLLLLAGTTLVFATAAGAAAALGALLLLGVLGALLLGGHVDSVFVRDVGLLGALVGLALAYGRARASTAGLAGTVVVALVVAAFCWSHGLHAPSAVQLGGVGGQLGALAPLNP